MIKIFRKNRQNSLTEGKTGNYIKYAIGETVLVVIGILIALQINNYNEERKLHRLRQDYYKQILVNLKDDNKDVEKAIKRIDSSITNYNIYTETFKEPNLPVVVIIQNLIKIRNDNHPFEFQNATIKSLISNGETKLLDPDIANYLTNYNTSKEVLKTTFQTYKNSYFAIFKEVLMDGYGFGSRLSNQKELLRVISNQQREQQMYIKLDAYHLYKSENEKWFIKSLRGLLKEIDNAIILITNKIEE